MKNEEVIQFLKAGKVGVMPTDTIYGIVGSALNPQTVEEIYVLRKRAPDKSMIILISAISDLEKFEINLDQDQINLLEKIWPNPVSVVLSCPGKKFEYLHRGKNSLAFRMPKDEKLLKLIRQTGPLVAPSANFEGSKPAENIIEAKNYFGESLSFYVDGREIKGEPSTLIEFDGNSAKVLRQGSFDLYKVLVTDFDSTLVGKNREVSEGVKVAIRKLLNKNYIVCIATGRPYQGTIKKICRELNLTAPQIVSGGSEIVDPKNDQVIWYEYFPETAARELIEYFLGGNYRFSVESEGCVFTLGGVSFEGYGPGIIFKDLKMLNYGKVAKMVLTNVSLIGDPKELQDRLNKIFSDLHFVRSGLGKVVLDITSARATKHLAILTLSKVLNIDPRFMIGAGDSYNDYSLLSTCGFKVAMEDAPPELKEIADLIIPDVKHDGLVDLVNNLYRSKL